MLTSTAPGPERTLRLHNSTSRGIDVFWVDEDGREFPLTEAPVARNRTEMFFVNEGTVIVFRRPDVPPAISEYARIRVDAKPT
jgi:hypothetical protein